MKFTVSRDWVSSKGDPLIGVDIEDDSHCGILYFTHEIAFRLRVSDFSYFDGDIIAYGSWDDYTEEDMNAEYPGLIENIVKVLKENPNLTEGDIEL